MYRLRNITFLLTIISCLTVKTIKTQQSISATVVIIIMATATTATHTNANALTISSMAAVITPTEPATTTRAALNITKIETPTYSSTSITTTMQFKNGIFTRPTTTTTTTTATTTISPIRIRRNADASSHMNSSVKNKNANANANANAKANVNVRENANVNFSLPGTYQAYSQQQQQQQSDQEQDVPTIKKSINSKGLKLPLTILTKQQQQQQQAILSIAQTIQKPFQNFFNGIFNRNQASPASSSSSVGNATATTTTNANTVTLNTTLYTCSCRCGERNDETRIVGGSVTAANEYPWMARLSYFNRFYCGGTLINDRYVLSAAHCIKGFMWFMIKVTFGEHDRCKIKDRPETRFVLRAFTQKFSFANFDNDIALLRLNDRVPISNFIKPICLPRIKERDNQFVGIKAIATGWGTLKEDGKPSCVLQEVTVPVLDNHVCVVQTNYTQKMITKNMLCAGYPGKGEKDSCQGDSGGPLIRTRPDDQRYEQIGIVSWGNGCARPNYPGVYTRVTKYLDWVIENSKDGCFCEDKI